MKAIHKYNPHSKEGARRIAQSHGWKISIHDMPKMIALLKRGGIDIETHDTIDPMGPIPPKAPIADTTELKL